MAFISYPDLTKLDAQAQRIIDAFVQEHGRPTPLYNSIMNAGKFDRKFKELLFVAASHVRNCFY